MNLTPFFVARGLALVFILTLAAEGCSAPAAAAPGKKIMTVTADDWSKAETIATPYLKKEKHAVEPIAFHRNDTMPFILGASWNGGDATVLVYDGKVQTARGMKALSAYFMFLGVDRLRKYSMDEMVGLLGVFEAGQPAHVGDPWSDAAKYPELNPAIVDKDGVVKYVLHFIDKGPAPTQVPGDPPLPRPGGRPADAPLVLQRWSLQLFPVKNNLAWKFEGRVERSHWQARVGSLRRVAAATLDQ